MNDAQAIQSEGRQIQIREEDPGSPQKCTASQRGATKWQRQYRAVKADPEKYAAYLAKQRARYRLKRRDDPHYIERNKAYRKEYWQRPEVKEKNNRYHKTRDKKKVRARWTVNNLKRTGKLIPKPCEKCGNPISEAHHPDYEQPKLIRWLCVRCHGAEHAK